MDLQTQMCAQGWHGNTCTQWKGQAPTPAGSRVCGTPTLAKSPFHKAEHLVEAWVALCDM